MTRSVATRSRASSALPKRRNSKTKKRLREPSAKPPEGLHGCSCRQDISVCDGCRCGVRREVLWSCLCWLAWPNVRFVPTHRAITWRVAGTSATVSAASTTTNTASLQKVEAQRQRTPQIKNHKTQSKPRKNKNQKAVFCRRILEPTTTCTVLRTAKPKTLTQPTHSRFFFFFLFCPLPFSLSLSTSLSLSLSLCLSRPLSLSLSLDLSLDLSTPTRRSLHNGLILADGCIQCGVK